MIRIPISAESAKYDAVIDHGALAHSGDLLRGLVGTADPVFIVTVAPVRRRWGKTLTTSLRNHGFKFHVIEMPDGERFKRIATLERLCEDLLRLGADRKSVVLALGGGVVGDVGGMLASVYMRGVRLVQVPTTVQAQLDAAIGGKTGVNLRAGKNLVGTFYQPRLVLIDPATLETLPMREFRAGMVEALKAGIIGNAELFARLEQCSMKELRADGELTAWAIAESVRLKAQVVSADEREGDLRRVLNLGHTLGHAFEAATGYKHFLHGEAVAWGMWAAARISLEMNCCQASVYERIVAAILNWGKLPSVTLQVSKALRLLQSDKKTERGVVNFVLPKEIGKVEIVKNVPQEVIAAALAEIRQASRG